MRDAVVDGQVSPKGVGTGMPFATDRDGAFDAAARRATRLRLLSVVGAIDDDPDERAEADRAEVAVLIDLALRPAASHREYEVKRSTFA